MDALTILLKIGKLLGVAAFFAGAIGATYCQSYADRQRFAYRLAAPGFFAVWVFGVAMSQFSHISLASTWLMGGAAMSLVTINAVLYATGREERATRGARIAALAPLVIALVLMVWRP